MNYEELCGKVREIALRAGRYIAAQRETFTFDKVEFKGAHNLVSYVDKQTEQMVIAALRELLPEAGFIAEEGSATYKGERYKWVIDPLDGTTNFVHGLPPYCVSLALMDGDEVVVGVIYEVTLGEMFYAWKDSDAYLNGRKITVSKVDQLENALIAIGFSYSALTGSEGFLDKIAWYQLHTDGIRRLGSAAADLAYFACGRVDAFTHVRLSPWDVAAGALIAERAGAVVTDFSGGRNFIFGGEIVAANPMLYDEFVKTLG